MPAINPLIVPAGPFDRLPVYWWATFARLSYVADPSIHGPALFALVGGAYVDRVDDPPGLAFDLGNLPTAQAVSIRGTETGIQLIAEIIQSALTTREGYPGRVGAFFVDRAQDTREAILSRIVGPWVASGHSLGGSVAALACSWGPSPPLLCVDFGSPRSGDATYAQAQTRPRLRVTNQADPVACVPILDGLTPPRLPWPGARPGYMHWGSRVHLWPDCSATRPRGQDWVFAELGDWLLEVINGAAAAAAHAIPEYARRIRGGIPVPFAALPDPDFPGLAELDAINAAMNLDDGVEWDPLLGPNPPEVFAFPTC